MTQKEQVLAYLETGASITPLEALDKFGSFRLAAVIHTLKAEGYPIRTEMVEGENGKRWGRYSLIVPANKEGQLEMSI